MPSASFKFDNPEEQSAFVKLISFLPRLQHWDDLEKYPLGNTCHICSIKTAVKSGIVPMDAYFEQENKDCYTFWGCCLSCHNQGWNLPHTVTRRSGIRYQRFTPLDKKEEVVITDFKVFKFPSVVLVGTDTVSITV